MKKLLTILTAFLVIALFSATTDAASITSAQTGNWSSTTTWTGGVVPVSGDDVTIEAGHTVTLDESTANLNSCTVAGTGILDASTFTLNVSGAFTLQSNATFKQGGTVTTVPGGSQSFATTSTYIFNGTQTALPAATYGNLTWSSSLNAPISGNLTVNGNLTLLNSGELRGTNSTAKTHTVAGNVDIDGSSAVLEGAVGSGTGNCTWNISGNVTTESSGGVLRGSFGATTTGNTSYNIGGNVINNGTIDFTGGQSAYANTLTFNGSSAQNISGNALTYPTNAENITVNNSAGVVLNTDVELTGTLALMSGSLSNGTHLTLDGASTINCSGGTLGTAPTFPTGFNLIYSGNVTTGNELPTSGELGQLTISATGTVTLAASTTVTGTLTFSSGKIALGSHNLTMGNSPGTISGASSSQYVVTNSAGFLIQSVPNTSTNVTFPVGTGSSYNPVILNNGGTTQNYSVRVANSTANVLSTAGVVGDQWTINEATNGGSNITMNLQWNGAEEGASFTSSRNSGQVARYSGSGTNWTLLTTSTPAGSDPYTAQVTGMTGTGIFQNTVYSLGIPGALPVEITSFTATGLNNEIELAWATATEINNYGFDIERSTINNEQSTINNWAKVGFVAGHGTTNAPQSYLFTDASARVGKFSYRLKQIDHSGNFVYSQTIEATVGVTPGTVWLDNNYPNPFNPSTKISFVLGTKGHATLKVYNLLGQEVATIVDGEFNDGEVQTFTFDASKLSSGIYYYQLESDNKTEIKKMMLLK